MGGLGENLLNSTEQLIDGEDRWKRGPDLPHTLQGASAATLDNTVYLTGQKVV